MKFDSQEQKTLLIQLLSQLTVSIPLRDLAQEQAPKVEAADVLRAVLEGEVEEK